MGVDFSLRVSRVRLAPEGRSSRDAIGSTLRGVLQNLKDRIFVTFNKQLHHNPISNSGCKCLEISTRAEPKLATKSGSEDDLLPEVEIECVCSCDQKPYFHNETKGSICLKIV